MNLTDNKQDTFYGPEAYSSMIAQGKIARHTRIMVLMPEKDGFRTEEYRALNQARIERNGSKMDPKKVLDDKDWLVPKDDLNPLEKASLG